MNLRVQEGKVQRNKRERGNEVIIITKNKMSLKKKEEGNGM